MPRARRRSRSSALTGVKYRGFEEMTTGFDEMVGAAQNYRVEIQQITDLGGDQISWQRRWG